jgi:inhibitor of cysteine peptidase
LGLQIDENANGETLDVTTGESVEVRLSENPTTGFRWHLIADGSPTCAIVEDSFSSEVRPPGKGGIHTWKFEAVRAGESDIELQYRRRWETGVDAKKRFRLHVRVGTGRRDLQRP